ncbi:MAG: glycosyltransferase, partial [Mucilaginibacter polytrichastri]|nr:glycosyltransferase [Mucilaginibacter polytrichastri]
MKVVHLNAYDGNGGAGRACLRLNTALRDQGIDSELWVNFAFGRNEHVASFADTFWRKAIRAVKIKTEQALTKPRLKALKLPFSWPVFGRDVHDHPALKNADIIHLHWINHAFLTPENIGQLKKLNKPVVWTFHDSNAFTGGCHVRYTCDHFEHECGDCPLLKKTSQKDLSYRIWKRKSAAYQGLLFPVIAPSSWMKTSVKRSALLNDRTIEVIPNTLETDIFHPS